MSIKCHETRGGVVPHQNKVETMIVCIAEKPSVAKDIARIIGATKSHDGYMEEWLPGNLDFWPFMW